DRRRRRGGPEAGPDLDQLADRTRLDRQGGGRRGRRAGAGRHQELRDRRRPLRLSAMKALRWATWLAGLWAGVLLGIGLIGAPAGFATSLPETAGRAAGRMFAQEAYLSLLLA